MENSDFLPMKRIRRGVTTAANGMSIIDRCDGARMKPPVARQVLAAARRAPAKGRDRSRSRSGARSGRRASGDPREARPLDELVDHLVDVRPVVSITTASSAGRNGDTVRPAVERVAAVERGLHVLDRDRPFRRGFVALAAPGALARRSR